MKEGLNPHQHPRQLAVPVLDVLKHPRVIRLGANPGRQWIRTARLVWPHLHAEEVLAELSLHRVRDVNSGRREEASDVAEEVNGGVAAGQGEPLGDPNKEREELLVVALNGLDVRELVRLSDGEQHVRGDVCWRCELWHAMRLVRFCQWAGELQKLVVIRGVFPTGSGTACVQAVLMETEGAFPSLIVRRVGLGVMDCPCRTNSG